MDTCQATLLQSSGRTQWRNWAPGFQRVFWTSKNKGKTKSHSSWALWFTLADYILNSRHPQLRMSEQMPLPIPASCTMAPASVSQIPERRRGIVSGVFRFGNVAFIHGASPTKIFRSKRKHSLELQVKNGTNLNQENTCKKKLLPTQDQAHHLGWWCRQRCCRGNGWVALQQSSTHILKDPKSDQWN